MLNMNFSEPVVIETGDMEWVPSPAPGVMRKPLAREEQERGHATSIVRYDPGSSFKQHYHPLGEEIFVLEGVFSDEHGDYGAGTYLRNHGFLRPRGALYVGRGEDRQAMDGFVERFSGTGVTIERLGREGLSARGRCRRFLWWCSSRQACAQTLKP